MGRNIKNQPVCVFLKTEYYWIWEYWSWLFIQTCCLLDANVLKYVGMSLINCPPFEWIKFYIFLLSLSRILCPVSPLYQRADVLCVHHPWQPSSWQRWPAILAWKHRQERPVHQPSTGRQGQDGKNESWWVDIKSSSPKFKEENLNSIYTHLQAIWNWILPYRWYYIIIFPQA